MCTYMDAEYGVWSMECEVWRLFGMKATSSRSRSIAGPSITGQFVRRAGLIIFTPDQQTGGATLIIMLSDYIHGLYYTIIHTVYTHSLYRLFVLPAALLI